MILTKIIIENFKSIKKIEFDIKKYWNSYTTMLLWINESWKSNILEAMSFLNVPTDEYDYDHIHNQKDEKNNPIDIRFYMEFENTDMCLRFIRRKILVGWDLLTIKIKNIIKRIYLEDWDDNFSEEITYEIEWLKNDLYIVKKRKSENINWTEKISETFELTNFELTWDEELLTEPLFREIFGAIILNTLQLYQPSVTFWKPSDEYLISNVDLKTFSKNIYSNIPLKNIFALAHIVGEENIRNEISKIENDSNLRRRLMSKLSTSVTSYIKDIWKHNIAIDVEITYDQKCIVCVKDDWKDNEHNFFTMNMRSEGFKQFISLILSLSIETRELQTSNELILIDEPENHLHPSWIRDLSNELLKIWENNYLFVSTHSPFLIDRNNKERNIIIRKNQSSLTEKKEITKEEDIRDDEVLDAAFGINIYKDLLIPNRILVEGYSDKLILQKAFSAIEKEFWITNWTWSNIVQVACHLNHDDIKVITLVDDDEQWKLYKEKILTIRWLFTENSVFTIRDLVWEIKNEWTIEDLLWLEYVEAKFKKIFKDEFGTDTVHVFTDEPFIKQIKIHLQRIDKFSDDFLEKFKELLSEDLMISKRSFESKLPLLYKLTNELIQKI